MTLNIAERIAGELNVSSQQTESAINLLDEGATVPFIARYRKEVTGALDDGQLRTLEERLHYLREMEERREAILKSIAEQEKLTPELEQQIIAADTKSRLEDLYLPYKPKRRTKGQVAIEAGLEPLADKLFADPSLSPEAEAEAFLNPEAKIDDVKAALDGAKYILMERFAEQADLLAKVRDFLNEEALLISTVVEGKEEEGAKFRDYFDHKEPLAKVPSHRMLAMLRGRKESILTLKIDLASNLEDTPADTSKGHPCEVLIAEFFAIEHKNRAADDWLQEVVRWTWRVKLYSHLETDLIGGLRESAEEEAIRVFASNLRDLLLAAPAGARITLGLDPGLRTGAKMAVVDRTGKLLDFATIYPVGSQAKKTEASAKLIAFCETYKVELIAIGNGTASRETDEFVADTLKDIPDHKIQKLLVSEAGASVYSASEQAAKEFPDLDVTIRGAVSIARRLQDPLAELVKIDPKSIGVGQYQHDVSQTQLARQLDAVVEDCVNAVGVDLNTASAPLLARVSGLNQSIATNIVSFRDQEGRFNNRESLKKVPRLGEKTYEQAAGFLRILDGDNPLDASAVHPESYPVVAQIAQNHERELTGLVGDSSFLKSVNAETFVTEEVGLLTLVDILKELEKPGRDPRPEFKTARFQEGVNSMNDLIPGMVLEGTVTNVTNFGAFVDIGVHQDGLVHISMLANKFVKDPRDVAKAGDIVKVKVLEVDQARKRIGLSMRLDDEAEAPNKGTGAKNKSGQNSEGAPNQGRKSAKSNHSKRSSSGGGRNDSGRKSGAGKGRGGQQKEKKVGTMGELLQQALNNKK